MSHFATRLLTAFLALLAVPASAETLIDNVDGFAIGADGEAVRFTGLVIGEDGRIEKLLDRKDKRPKKPDYVVDGKGRTLIPGFVDSHVPVMTMALATLSANGKAEGASSATQGEARATPAPRPEDRDVAFDKIQRELLALGVTAVADMGTTIEAWQTYRRAGDRGALQLRIAAYAADVADMVLIGGPGPTPWLYDGKLRLNGLHIALDGSLDSRGAALKLPYADGSANGELSFTDTQLRNMMSRAALDNFQVAISATGDAAIATALAALDELKDTYNGDRRWRIENATLIDPTDMARLANHAAIASFAPKNLGATSLIAEERLGPARLPLVQPWNTARLAGITLVFGSGNVRHPVSPLSGIAAAITRESDAAQPFGGWQPQERLTREAALAAYTARGAHAMFADGRFGHLAEGEYADFLFIDRDPLVSSPGELRIVEVLETWIGGVKVHEAAAPRPASEFKGR